MNSRGPILRVFKARAKPNCVGMLLENFRTTSASVVSEEPGNKGYFFGRCLEDDVVLFVSIWEDMSAIKSKFGHDWQISYMPDGYSELIENCSVRHFDMADGWKVEDLRS